MIKQQTTFFLRASIITGGIILLLIVLLLMIAIQSELMSIAHVFLLLVLGAAVLALCFGLSYGGLFLHRYHTHTQLLKTSRLTLPQKVSQMVLKQPERKLLPEAPPALEKKELPEEDEQDWETFTEEEELPDSPLPLREDKEEFVDIGIPRVDFPHLQEKLAAWNKEGRILLGLSEKGYVLGTLKDLLSTLIVGRPGMGKTSFLFFLLAQLFTAFAGGKGKFCVLDPNSSLAELSDSFLYASNIQKVFLLGAKVEEEFLARKERFDQNGGKCVDPPFVLIIDEVPAIAHYEERQRKLEKERKLRRPFHPLLPFLMDYVLEGRKYNMYCFLTGQAFPVTILPSTTRDNMTSRFIFLCSEGQAAMAGLSKEKHDKELLEMIKRAGPGYAIMDAALLADTKIVRIPLTTVQDIARMLEQQGRRKPPVPKELPQKAATDQEEKLILVPGYGKASTTLVMLIKDAATRVKSRRQILGEIGKGGEYYALVRAVCDAHGLLSQKGQGEDLERTQIIP